MIDAFVDELDLRALSRKRRAVWPTIRHDAEGLRLRLHQPDPVELTFGARNVGMMWLTGRLAPNFKAITDFRKDNGPAIRSACRQFVALCRSLNLFAHAMVALDGSRFKAVNSRERSFSRGSIERR